MKNNVIALPGGRIKRNGIVFEKKMAKNPDLFVNMVENNPGHVARREARRNAYYQGIQQKQKEDERLLQNVGTTAMFAMLDWFRTWILMGGG